MDHLINVENGEQFVAIDPIPLLNRLEALEIKMSAVDSKVDAHADEMERFAKVVSEEFQKL
jgi:hypothetical protein